MTRTQIRRTGVQDTRDILSRMRNIEAASRANVNPALNLDPTGTVDVTNALNALAAAGDSLDIPAGTYLIEGHALIPVAGQNFLGAGSGKTVFSLGPGGVLNFGVRGTPGLAPGGKVGGFTIQGNNAPPTGLYLGLQVMRIFEDIVVENTTGDGTIIEAAQNCEFRTCWFRSSTGNSCLAIDYGAGGHRFINCEINGFSKYALEIRQSGASPPGVYPTSIGPTDNLFLGCRLEQAAPLALANLHHAGGGFNRFINCGFDASEYTGPTSCVALIESGVAPSFVEFLACDMLGGGAATAAIRATGGTFTTLTRTTIGGFANAYTGTATDAFSRSDMNYNLTGAEWAQLSGASVPPTAVLSGQAPTAWVPLTYTSTWADLGAGFAPGAFRRVGNTIELRGVIIAGASPTTTVATGLPSPPHVLIWPLAVTSTGAVTGEFSITLGTLETNINLAGQKIFLDGLSYQIDE